MKNQGLTLLEILVATMLMSLMMFGLGTIFVAGQRHLSGSRAQITAAQLGKYYLANVSLDVRQDTWGHNCLSNSSDCASFTRTIDGTTYAIRYDTASMVDGNLSKAKVIVNWNETSPD
jgi:hypothetical protein